MSEVEELPCPACGARVATSGGPTYTERVSTSGGESYSTVSATESRRCPSCGAELERVVSPGAAWRLAG